jgi:hypothetical protein
MCREGWSSGVGVQRKDRILDVDDSEAPRLAREWRSPMEWVDGSSARETQVAEGEDIGKGTGSEAFQTAASGSTNPRIRYQRQR